MPTFVFIPVSRRDYNAIQLRFFDENYRSQKCDKSSQRHDSSRIVETAIHRVCIVKTASSRLYVKTAIHRVFCSGKIS
ncbi:hypothetical protein [Nostoc sp. DSM 114167]|jgi:hypothetical protein|uniref:hypothetical protein n=1 Tax=Nostoc sp. DSM 114167 TaxID=3439050 RepID=UPI004045A495